MEEELQQLHFHEQSGGLPDTKKPAAAEPRTTDDCVWEYYADIINKGDYHTEARKPWTGSYASTLAKSNKRYVAAGDEHSSYSDEELITSLRNSFFKPVQCPEEEDAPARSRAVTDEKCLLRRRPQPVRHRSSPLPPRGPTKSATTPHAVSAIQHTGVPKTEATGELVGAKTNLSNESSSESGCSP